MKYGVVLPGGTADQQLRQAILAEAHGWFGVFVWEAAYGVDAWTLLGAMAARTSRVMLGTNLTPLPWRRPWKVASQAVTLDQISGGRAIVGIGLGAVDNFLGETGEVIDRKIRAEAMDEGIDLMRGLWRGDLVFQGKHYQMDISGRTDLAEVGRPVQTPIPLWVVGAWPSEKSMNRVLRCQGILPNVRIDGQFASPRPSDLGQIRNWLAERSDVAHDIIADGETPIDDQAAATDIVRPFAEAGATWWLETRWDMALANEERMRQIEARIKAGPPILSS